MQLDEKKVKENISKSFKTTMKTIQIIYGIEIMILTITVELLTNNVFYSAITLLIGITSYFLIPIASYNSLKCEKLYEKIELEKLKK